MHPIPYGQNAPRPPFAPQQPRYAPQPPRPPAGQPQQPPAPLAQPPALPPGTLLANRYRIEGYIGGGGFGHIYRALDTALGHVRAVKEAFYRDTYTQRQFRLEAEFILNTRHPNLVCGYTIFEQGGRFYLVMDYVDGHTLEELAIRRIRTTGLPPPEAEVLDWMAPICDAVATLHAQPLPIIHRDVKPANVKLTRRGAPVLIDLGLAKLYLRGTKTIGAALAFTPGYAPPEQYQAAGATDRRTDVYGIGASLYFLLTGYQPTEAPARLGPQALPAPRTRNPALSERVDALVLKAMALDPAERFQSVPELLAELRALRAALPAARSAAPLVLPAHADPSLASAPQPQPSRDAQTPATPDAARDGYDTPAPVSTPLHRPSAGATAPTAARIRAAAQAGRAPAGARGRGIGEQPRPGEAEGVIAAILALICASLCFLALLHPLLLLFGVPTLAFGVWSLLRLGAFHSWRRLSARPDDWRAYRAALDALWLRARLLWADLRSRRVTPADLARAIWGDLQRGLERLTVPQQAQALTLIALVAAVLPLLALLLR